MQNFILKKPKFSTLTLIYAVFILAWFIVVGLRKFDFSSINSTINSINYLFAPIFELALFFALCAFLMRFGKLAKLGVAAFSLVFFLIYAVQYYYFFVSGEFLAFIALENADQLYLLLNFKLYAIIILSILAVIALWIGFNLALATRERERETIFKHFAFK